MVIPAGSTLQSNINNLILQTNAMRVGSKNTPNTHFFACLRREILGSILCQQLSKRTQLLPTLQNFGCLTEMITREKEKIATRLSIFQVAI